MVLIDTYVIEYIWKILVLYPSLKINSLFPVAYINYLAMVIVFVSNLIPRSLNTRVSTTWWVLAPSVKV